MLPFWNFIRDNKWVIRYQWSFEVLGTEKMRATYNTTSSKVHTMHHIPSTTFFFVDPLYDHTHSLTSKLLDFHEKRKTFSSSFSRLTFFTKNGEWFKNHERKNRVWVQVFVCLCAVAIKLLLLKTTILSKFCYVYHFLPLTNSLLLIHTFMLGTCT